MPYLGEIAGLMTSVFWTFTALMFTAASQKIGSFQVNLLRIPLALLFILGSYLLISGSFAANGWQLQMLALSGVIGLVIGDTFLFEAYVQIGTRLTLLVFSLSPAMTALIAYFVLQERISTYCVLGIGVTILGILLVLSERKMDTNGQPRQISVAGISFALLGGLAQAVGLVLAKSAFRTPIEPLLATLIRMAAATLFIWPVAALIGKIQNPLKLFRGKRAALPLLLGGSFFGPFLGIFLSLVAIQHTNTGVAATLMSLMPILIIPLDFAFHHDKPSLRAVLGTVVAVAGVAILFLR